MDRVFEQAGRPTATALPSVPPQHEPAIEVEVRDTSQPWRHPWRIAGLQLPPGLALGLAAGLGCLTLVGGISLWLGWNEARNDLRQERNLRLLEGIRSLESSTEPNPAAQPNQNGDGLPPPPPNEPWIQDLGQLESGSGGGVAPLQGPLNGTLQTPAPPAAPASGSSAAATGASPELLGVVQIPGKPGSAIFQVGGSSTNALVGETIGSSGWRLVSTTGDSAVIERGGATRRVSISSGF